MASNSKIEWTHHTFNPWIGCTKVSEGCKHCYAESLMDTRYKKVEWGPRGTRRIKAESGWREPYKWDRLAAEAGERHRVFCASLCDIFEGADTMPVGMYSDVRNARARAFKIIGETPNLDWLLLTKRPENAPDMVREAYEDCLGRPVPETWPWWLGTSVENQAAADERILHLLRCAAAVRFLSCEPLLGAVDLTAVRPAMCDDLDCLRGGWHDGSHRIYEAAAGSISLVIVGGESGPGARPMHPDWARSLRDQCQSAGVAFFFKQWGALEPASDKHRGAVSVEVRRHGGLMTPLASRYDPTMPCDGVPGDSQIMCKVGKKAAGRLLDGREWNELPGAGELPGAEANR